MKKLQLFAAACALSVFTMNAQTPEVGPASDAPVNQNRALFDLLYQWDVGSSGSVGVDGLAGVIFFNDQYWISEWATDIIHVLDADGNFVETFVIAGVTGTRSFTTDGTNIYIGGGSTSIYVIDPATKTLTDEIFISTSTDSEARMCTYDETLDGGNGGFWIGDFGSDIISVDMDGDEIDVIPAGDHGTTIYGGAIDNITDGGPYLWIHDQSGTAPNRGFITQIEIATGLPTGVVYDYTTDGGNLGATEVLAGGLFITDEVVDNTVAFVGLCQCTPSNQLFGLELQEVLSTGDNNLSEFSLYPNPSSGSTVRINTGVSGDIQVAVYDVLGKRVMNTVVSNNELNISGLTQGVYMVRIIQNGLSATKKLIVK